MFALTSTPGAALACSCAELPIDEAFEHYDSIFVGVVTSEEPSQTGSQILKFNFRVSETYKGDPGERRTVYSHHFESACGYYFHEGLEYLVFASIPSNPAPQFDNIFYQPGKLNVSLCSPTTHTEPSNNEIRRQRIMNAVKRIVGS